MPLCIALFGSQVAVILFLIALVAVALFEILRRQEHALGRMLHTLFAPVLRTFELSDSPKLTGAMYMLIGAVLVTALAPADVAMTALAVLMISDSCAALIGKRWGRHPIAGKSMEGSAAFLLSAICITSLVGLLAEHAYSSFLLSGIAASIVATLVELYTARIRMDDNLSIPISFAGVQSLLLFCFG